MKKLLFLISIVSILLISFQTQSQTVTKTANYQFQTELKPNVYEFIYNGKPGDTVSTATGDSVWLMNIFTKKTDALYSNHQFTLTKVGSTALSVNVYLLGKYFSTDSRYDTLSTASFKGTVTDTTINTKLFTSKLGYNYYLKKVVLTSGRCKISKYKSYYRR